MIRLPMFIGTEVEIDTMGRRQKELSNSMDILFLIVKKEGSRDG